MRILTTEALAADMSSQNRTTKNRATAVNDGDFWISKIVIAGAIGERIGLYDLKISCIDGLEDHRWKSRQSARI